jgi:hypothetical protein
MNILKWFKHQELVNTETEGDRHARETFHKQLARADKEMKKDFGEGKITIGVNEFIFGGTNIFNPTGTGGFRTYL